MVLIDDILISEEIFERKFVCNLDACKGMCCVYGDSGAPVLKSEVAKLKKNFKAAAQYMNPENIEAVKKQGFAIKDNDGDLGTPLLNNAECCYVTKEKGIVLCAYEKAYLNGQTKWRKPVSCFLYPIRVSQLGPYKAINFHYWQICNPALQLGKSKGIAAYIFLKTPLIETFGQDFYDQLCIAAEIYYKNGNKSY